MSTPESTQSDHVVVGTDGSPAGTRGVGIAAREAQSRGLPLEIVHVSPGYLPVGPVPMAPEGTLQFYGHQVLERARTAAVDVAPDIDIHTTLATGRRVDCLVHAARDAALLVLGTHARGLSERIWTGATVTGVAARATCPVWVVPDGVEPDRGAHRIVVAVKSLEHPHDLLVPVLEEARASGAEVRLVHAWRVTGGYDDMIAGRVRPAEWSGAQREIVLERTEDLRAAYPDVVFDVHVEHGQAARVLAHESESADRLVISRPLHGGAVHHLGATARALLRTSRCLVEVLPPVKHSSQGTTSSHDRFLEMSSGPPAKG